jgi:hypothetical protein
VSKPDVGAFLAELLKARVTLWIHGDRLSYRAPPGALSVEQLSALREHKAEIMRRLMRSEAASPAEDLRFTDLVPVSFQQEWSIELHRPLENDPNLITVALRMRGALSVESLRQSMETIIRRHGSLRTRIVSVEGLSLQKVAAPSEYALSLDDFSDEPSAAAHAKAQRLINDLFRRPLNLAIESPFQARLIRLAHEDHVLAIAIHHLVADGASIVVFFRELWAWYAQYAYDVPASLPQAVSQYADYTLWQRSSHARWIERNQSYWDGRLSGAEPIRLPRDSGLNDVRRFKPAGMSLLLDKPLSDALHELARARRLTSGIILVSIYSALVWRWSRQARFILPFNVAGRHLSEHVNTMGFFSHPLLLRVELTGVETFSELLTQAQEEFMAAHDHLDYGNIAGSVPEILNGTFFQWMASSPIPFPGLPAPAAWQDLNHRLAIEPYEFEPERLADPTLPNDIALDFLDTDQGIRGWGAYRADLFSRETMQRFVSHFQSIAEQAVRDPQTRLSSFLLP